MTRAKAEKLSHEDRILWGKVARSVKPLPGKSFEEAVIEEEDFALLLHPPEQKKRAANGQAEPVAPDRPTRPHLQQGIDKPTRTRIAKGRLPIEGKVDLHGLTQTEAHALLLSFLHRAYADGRRHVLVVTGKGSSLGSEGVLRRAVPAWLATPMFRALVGGHEMAARHHGGDGAIYIRLRKSGGGA